MPYPGIRNRPANHVFPRRFDYTPMRARDGPQRFPTGFEGYLQADAFGGYDGIYLAARGAIVEVACNAHARRKFYDAQNSDAARSHAALAWYRQLYALEKEAKEQIEAEHLDGASTDALRVRLRQEKALPLWTGFPPDGSGHQLYLRQLGCAGALHRGRRFLIGSDR